jgi:hypothetical protein
VHEFTLYLSQNFSFENKYSIPTLKIKPLKWVMRAHQRNRNIGFEPVKIRR